MFAALNFTDFLPKQVSFVQYSDNAKTEFKLNSYRDKGLSMAALHLIHYQGGNTKTGRCARNFYRSLTPLFSRGFLFLEQESRSSTRTKRRSLWKTG